MSSFASDDSTSFACLFGVIDMACPDDGLVFIVSAEYGQYASECGDECCDPIPGADCTESMEEYSDISWTNLKLACNYNSQCEFQHMAHAMTSCSEERLADYMSINYICSNGEWPRTSRIFTISRLNVLDYPNHTLQTNYILVRKSHRVTAFSKGGTRGHTCI